jgi:very-short-patch-repair endonuclease
MSEKMRGNQNGLGKSASVETRTKLAASVRKSWQNADKRKAAQSERSKGNTWGGMREITPEYLAGLGEKARFHAQKDLPDCPCPMHNAEARLVRAYGIKRTGIEAKLCDVLLAEFPEVQEQVRFGDYMVDAYLPPPYHLVFEADGEYWHQHPKKDAARDKYLLRRFGLPVVRLRGKELMEMV